MTMEKITIKERRRNENIKKNKKYKQQKGARHCKLLANSGLIVVVFTIFKMAITTDRAILKININGAMANDGDSEINFNYSLNTFVYGRNLSLLQCAFKFPSLFFS